eukprot:820748-Alexandrium_andersonii.AAC.1
MRHCQALLHRWGAANAVAFEADKESMHILSRRAGGGPSFHMLGVDFDCKLTMGDACHTCAIDCAWGLRTLVRTRRFHTDA